MVSKIDTTAVCGHFNGALSGVIPQSGIHRAVGRLVNQSPSNYVNTVQEIGLVFHNAMQGNFMIDPGEIPHLSVDSTDEYRDWNGLPVTGNHYKEEWINTCLHLPRSESTLKLWAGFTNLKSAAVIERLSRLELTEQRQSIGHAVTVDREHRHKWQRFLDEFVPYLVDKLSLDGKREYDILRSIPLSSKASRFVSSEGELCPCKRGDAAFADLNLALRHPVVNRIFRKYPDDAAAATIIGSDLQPGTTVLNEHMPLPFPRELPVGAAAVVPKDAQKPRVVWILVGALDSMSRPMFHKLEEIESRWNIQGVMDQDGARHHVSRVLAANQRRKNPKVVCSYDQSAFTDNFSYDYVQRPVVEALVKESILKEYDLSLLDEINHGQWDAKALGLRFETIRFGTGTGMGTPPSFPLASISNGMMVAYAYFQAYGKLPDPTGHNPPGLVVGDDCVIFDEKVARHYEEFCDAIGLKVNYNKSFKNDHIAEFCGKYITSTGIYSKRKLIYPSCLEATRDFISYYEDKADDYFRAYPELDDVGMTWVLSRIREIPAPFGAGRPVTEITPETATPLELATLNRYNLSRASQYLSPDLKGSRRDIREAFRRTEAVPPIADRFVLLQAEDSSDEYQQPSKLAESLARDVVDLYSSITPSAPWTELCQVAKEIAIKIDAIESLGSPKAEQTRVPTLVPKRVKEPTALEKLIELAPSGGDSQDDPFVELDL